MTTAVVEFTRKFFQLSVANSWEVFSKLETGITLVPGDESGSEQTLARLTDGKLLPVNREAPEDSETGFNENTPANDGKFAVNGGTDEDLEGSLNVNPRAQPIDSWVYRARL